MPILLQTTTSVSRFEQRGVIGLRMNVGALSR